jgi:hypothetical protein
MSLPDAADLKTMDWAFQGQPFVDVPAKSTIVLGTMDRAFQAQPFVRNEYGGTAVVTPKGEMTQKLIAAGVI